MEAFRIFTSSRFVSDSERSAWEAERNVWAQAQVALSQRLELETADAGKVRRDLIELQERLTAGHNDQSDQSGLIKELENKLQDAVAQINQHQDAHRLSRQEMARMLDGLMAEVGLHREGQQVPHLDEGKDHLALEFVLVLARIHVYLERSKVEEGEDNPDGNHDVELFL